MSANKDGELIRRLRSGEKAAVAELVERYGDSIRRHIRIELIQMDLLSKGNRDKAFESRVESKFDDVLLRFLKRVQAPDLNCGKMLHLLAYLKRMAKNGVIDEARRRKRTVPCGGAVFENLPGRECSADETVAAAELTAKNREMAERVRESLTKEERELMDLRVAGKTFPEIAAVLGGTAAKYRAKFQRICSRLQGEELGGGSHE